MLDLNIAIEQDAKLEIKLRKIKEQDLIMIMNWRMMPEVTEFMYTNPQLTLETQKVWYDKINSDPTCLYWIIVCNGIDIGVLGITDIDYDNKICNWNWYIGEIEFRGKGIAKQVQCNIFDFVFYYLNLNHLYSEVLTVNMRNLKAYEKCGYLIERILEKRIFKSGKYYDIAICGITKIKWEEIKSNYCYNKILIEV